ncbi:MAG: glycosyl hydrolase family 18 protein [Clostridia bacterium]|nr:glycosyl hydrolase family 18 protein [Clostridia bacterium]
MKKILTFITFLAAVLGVLFIDIPKGYAVGSRVDINVNGQRIYTDVEPFVINGRTMVPLSGIFQKLGAQIEWIGNERKVTVKYNNTAIALWIGSRKAYVNGITKQIDVAPVIVNGRTMIPLTFISENIGMTVRWIPEARLATVTDPAYFNNLEPNMVLGFATNDYQGDNGSYNSMTKYHNNLDSIATFSYRIDTSGALNMTGVSQQRAVSLANQKNISTLVAIHNFKDRRFDGSLAHSVLSNAAKRKALIDNIILVMSKESYSGVNVDIENVYWNDRAYYSAFIKELKERLTPYGFLTTVSIPAKTYDAYQNNTWSGAYDYKEIGKYADRILIMTYDEHYFGGSPGPISSLPWVKNVMAYATKTMPANKILLGIAAYGYDWSSSNAAVIAFKNADSTIANLGVQSLWNDTFKSPYFKYTKNGISHEVWYENASSISYKLDLVNTYKLGGIGIWKLGYENDTFWSSINKKIN